MSLRALSTWSDEDACWVCRVESGPLAPIVAMGHGDTADEAERQAREGFRQLVQALAKRMIWLSQSSATAT